MGTLRRRGEWTALWAAGVRGGLIWGGVIAPAIGAALVAVPLVLDLAPRALAGYDESLAGEGAAAPSSPPAFGPRMRSGADGWFVRLAPTREVCPVFAVRVDERGRLDTAVELAACGASVARRVRFADDAVALAEPGPVPPAVAAVARDARVLGRVERSARGLVGETLTAGALVRRVDAARRTGVSPAPLLAELALRGALVLACLVLPALGIAIVARGREDRAARLVGLGIALAAGYWLVLAATWSGAARGLWPAALVVFGAPGAAALAALGIVLWRARRRRATRPLPS